MDSSTAPVDPVALLQRLEADIHNTEDLADRAKCFRQVADLFEAQGRADEAVHAQWRALLFEFYAYTRGQRSDDHPTYLGPMISLGGRGIPMLDDLSESALDLFENDLQASTNPIHRARYAEVLWERRKNYQAARIAVGAYLDCARLYRENAWLLHIKDFLDRGAELSLSLRDEKGTRAVITACLEIGADLAARG